MKKFLVIFTLIAATSHNVIASFEENSTLEELPPKESSPLIVVLAEQPPEINFEENSNKTESPVEEPQPTAIANSHDTNCEADFKNLKLDISSYIDIVLGNLRQALADRGYSHVRLPNATVSHTTPFLGVNWTAVAAVDNGTLVGVESLHRTGASHVNFTDDHIIFSSDVGFKTLNMSYNLRAQFMNLGPKATVRGSLDGVSAFMSAMASRKAPVTVSLKDLKLSNIGKVRLDIDGGGALWDGVSDAVRENLGKVFTLFVRDLVENSIKDMLNSIISSTVLPRDPTCYALF